MHSQINQAENVELYQHCLVCDAVAVSGDFCVLHADLVAAGTESASGLSPSTMEKGDDRAERCDDSGPNVIDGRYEVLSLLGQGGMGTVYKVRDRQLGRIFALKLLRSELVPNRWVLKRFEAEIQATSALTHPHLVVIYGHGTTDQNVPYFVMDYVDGESLAAVLKREGYLQPTLAMEVFIQICDALIHAHQQGLIHRDLKPANVILSKTENGATIVKIVDFGIVKIVSDHKDQKLTQAEEIFGSPQYMSPEQCQGEKLDARSDIYSMGCLMYEVIGGRAPFTSEKPVQVLVQHLKEQPQPLELVCGARQVDTRLQGIVMTCLEKKAQDRYQSVQQLQRDLMLVQKGCPPQVCLSRVCRKLFKGSAIANMAMGCLLVFAIVILSVGIAYRRDLSWFLQYQRLVGSFSPRASEQQYLDLLKQSDAETVPNVLLKLGQLYALQAQTENGTSADFDKSSRTVDQAITLLRASGRNPGLLAQCYRQRASNDLALGHVDSAAFYARAAIKAIKRLHGEVADVRLAGTWYESSSFTPEELSATLADIAKVYAASSKNREAERMYDEAIELHEFWMARHKLLADPFGLGSADCRFIQILEQYASFANATGEKAKSRQICQRILALLKKPPYSYGVLSSTDELEAVGQLSMERGDLMEAEQIFRQLLAMRGKSNDDNHLAMAESRRLLGEALIGQKRYSEAELQLKEAVAEAKRERFLGDISSFSEPLAKLYWEEGRRAEAIRVLREGLSSNRNAENVLNHRSIDKSDYMVPDEDGYQQLADYHLQSGDLGEAAKSLADVVTISQVNGSDQSHQADVLLKYASALRKLNQNARAQKIERQAALLRAGKGGPQKPALIMRAGSE